MRKLMPSLLAAGMLSLVSCGGDSNGAGKSNPEREEGQLVTYRAVLAPLNNSETTGAVTLKRDGDNFDVDISIAGAPATVHMQHIHSGSACPTAANGGADNLVDGVDSETVTGPILIPLDSDLSGRDAGGIYPVGRSYHYNESTSWSAMTGDLGVSTLGLSGRVIVIHGTTAPLPDTVQGAEGETASEAFPVACGKLVVIPNEG